VVGSWHLLPLLAERVSRAFKQYAGDNPDMHISAGITLEGRKFPLYQAATRAGEALDGGAKKYEYNKNDDQSPKEHGHAQNDGRPLKKNAVNFLDQTVGWDDFAQVRQRADMIAKLVRQEEVPRGLLQTLQMIYNRFVEDRKEARRRGLSGKQVYYSPWMWRQAYYLKRFASNKSKEVQDKIMALQEWTLTHRIQYLGLAARWAEYLTRKQEE
jgi:CRISPR-associated protein Csm1